MTLPASNSTSAQSAIGDTKVAKAKLPFQASHQEEFVLIQAQIESLLTKIETQSAQTHCP